MLFSNFMATDKEIFLFTVISGPLAQGYGTGTFSGSVMELTPGFLWPLILHQRRSFTLKFVHVQHRQNLISFEN